MANNTPNVAAAQEAKPDLAVLQMMYQMGLHKEAQELEKRFGIALSAVDAYLSKFITTDPACIKLKEYVLKLSQHSDPVLICGETGTGKEIIAHALHGQRTGKFIAVNCAGFPRELVESELFGHAAGSFTGAKNETQGLVALADKGTLFLDEIGDLPLDIQAKLLRVMQEKTIRKVGAKEEEFVDVRFVGASHYDLRNQVKQKLFRLDLYARLACFELFIPPLRNRLGDIPLIIADLDKSKNFPTTKIDWTRVDLSLNVRALQRIVRRYTVLGEMPNYLNVTM